MLQQHNGNAGSTGSQNAGHGSLSSDPLQSALIRPSQTNFANIQNPGSANPENARAGIPNTFPGFVDPVTSQPVQPATNPLFSNTPE